METNAHAQGEDSPTGTISTLEFSAAITDICTALAEAQKAIKNAERDANNPFFESTYATLASVWDTAREPLTSNGLSVIQGSAASAPDGQGNVTVRVTTMLLHKSGQWFRSTITLPVIAVRGKKKNDDGDNDAQRAPGRVTPQAIGSAITYGRRYGLEAIAGVAAEAEDDDGNTASGGRGENKDTGAKPIPDSGDFEDVVKAVTSRDQSKAGGAGSFKIFRIETGEHGAVECYEAVGGPLVELAGNAEVMKFHAEKGKFGWKLINVVRKTQEDLDAEIALAWVKEHAPMAKDLEALSDLKNQCKNILKGPYWTDATNKVLNDRFLELGGVKQAPPA